MRRRVAHFMLVSSLVLTPLACRGASVSSQNQGTAAAQTSAQAKPAPASAAPTAAIKAIPAVVARVNGVEITKAQFDRALNQVQVQAGRPLPPEQRDEVYTGVIDQLVALELLLQETVTRRIAVADAEIEDRLTQIKTQFPNEEAFKKALAAQNETLDAVKAEIRKGMAMTKLMDQEVTNKVVIDPRQVSDFYASNPDKFKEPESISASHILIRVPQGADEKTKAAARTRAEGLHKRAAGGEDFAALAKATSEDTGSAPNGGSLGFFTRGQMVPLFEQAAFALKPGEVSAVIETQFGFHIIKGGDHRAHRAANRGERARHRPPQAAAGPDPRGEVHRHAEGQGQD